MLVGFPLFVHRCTRCTPFHERQRLTNGILDIEPSQFSLVTMGDQFHQDLNPPSCDEAAISYPAQHVLLVTITRAKKMNTTNQKLNWQLDAVWKWFDDEPSLRVAIITGEGTKAFCAGSDLIEIEAAQKNKDRPWESVNPPSASAGLARRFGKKPVLVAVNGIALGGGFEIVLNRLVVRICWCALD